jgi:hypothetical protein
VRGELVTAEAKAERDLSFTEIRAPFDGVVGNKAAVVGQYAMPGTRLLAVVPTQSAYVDANFKETQLDANSPRPEGRHRGRFVRRAGRARNRRIGFARLRRAVLASAARQRHRQFHQGRAARDGAHRDRAGSAGARAAALGLSVVATIHTRDESQPRPTLLGLFGLGATAGEAGAAK